jgi:hypothetical protein
LLRTRRDASTSWLAGLREAKALGTLGQEVDGHSPFGRSSPCTTGLQCQTLALACSKLTRTHGMASTQNCKPAQADQNATRWLRDCARSVAETCRSCGRSSSEFAFRIYTWQQLSMKFTGMQVRSTPLPPRPRFATILPCQSYVDLRGAIPVLVPNVFRNSVHDNATCWTLGFANICWIHSIVINMHGSGLPVPTVISPPLHTQHVVSTLLLCVWYTGMVKPITGCGDSKRLETDPLLLPMKVCTLWEHLAFTSC